MGFYDTTGFRPDAQLAKQMAGGGIGAALTALGGGFKSMYDDIEAKRQFDEKQKLGWANNVVSNRNADAQINANKLNADKFAYDKGRDTIADNELEQSRAKQWNSDLLTLQNSGIKEFKDMGMPAYSEMKALDSVGQQQTQGAMSSLLNRYKAITDANALAAEQKRKLELEAAKQSGSSTPKYSKPVKLQLKDGSIIDGFYDEVSGGVRDNNGVVRSAGTYNIITEKTPEQKASEIEFDAKAMQYVNDVFSEYSKTFGGKVDWILGLGNDNDEYEAKARKAIYDMYVNGDTKGLSKNQAIKEGYARAGAPIGLTGAQITNEEKNKNLVESYINGYDASKITPEVVSMYLGLNGEKTDSKTVNDMTTLIKSIVSQKAKRRQDMKDFADKNGLNENPLVRATQPVQSAIYGALDLAQKFGINPVGKKDEWKDKSEMGKEAAEKWSIGNAQFDVMPLIGEVIKYAPTVGISPYVASTRLMSAVGNFAKFGSADAALAYVYGDDWQSIGAISGGIGGTIGLFNKLAKNAGKPTVNFNKSYMQQPSPTQAYRPNATKPK